MNKNYNFFGIGLSTFFLLFLVGCQNSSPTVETQPQVENSNAAVTPSGEISSSNITNSNVTISELEAKAIALGHANLAEEEVGFLKVELSRDDGQLEYEIEFSHDNIRYEYDLNTETGEILSHSQEIHKENSTTEGSGTLGYNSTSLDDSDYIGKDEALRLALVQENLSQDDVSIYKVEFDFDDGIPNYEVGFIYENMEYEYEIHGETGTILSFEQEHSNKNDITGSNNITDNNKLDSAELLQEAQVKEIALSHAEYREDEISVLKISFEWEKGIPEYDVEWRVGQVEYDYKIHGTTGEILEVDIDRD